MTLIKFNIIVKNLFLIIFLVMNLKAFTRSDSLIVKNNIIKFNPIGPLGGHFTFGFEKRISKKISINIMIGSIDIIRKRSSIDAIGFIIMGGPLFGEYKPDYTDELTGYLVIPEIRYYFKHYRKNKFQIEFYGSPFFRYKYLKHVFTDLQKISSIYWSNPPSDTMYVSHKGVSTEISGGLTGGIQLLIRSFSVNVFLGPQLKYVDVDRIYTYPYATDEFLKEKYKAEFILFNGYEIGVRAGVNVGLAF